MRGVQTVHNITEATTTQLTQRVSKTDDTIRVVDAAALSAPDFDRNIWGVLTINGERIMYRERDTVANTVSSLLRGTAGTARANHEITAQTDLHIGDGITRTFTWLLPDSYGSDISTLQVYINTVLQTINYTVTATAQSIIVEFRQAPAPGDEILFTLSEQVGNGIVYNMSRSTLAPLPEQNYIVSYSDLADGTSTLFTTIDMTVEPALVAAVEVYVGGGRQLSDFTVSATAPVAVAFAAAPPADEEVTILIRRGTWWVTPDARI